uniref:MarR family transcriptional regulator n=1 Tax=Caenorhabditis tropicalis TaxID=1561998 RepID=A0A1I7URN5_9PELO
MSEKTNAVFRVLRDLEQLQERCTNSINPLPHHATPSYYEIVRRNDEIRKIIQRIHDLMTNEITDAEVAHIRASISVWEHNLRYNL